MVQSIIHTHTHTHTHVAYLGFFRGGGGGGTLMGFMGAHFSFVGFHIKHDILLWGEGGTRGHWERFPLTILSRFHIKHLLVGVAGGHWEFVGGAHTPFAPPPPIAMPLTHIHTQTEKHTLIHTLFAEAQSPSWLVCRMVWQTNNKITLQLEQEQENVSLLKCEHFIQILQNIYLILYSLTHSKHFNVNIHGNK